MLARLGRVFYWITITVAIISALLGFAALIFGAETFVVAVIFVFVVLVWLTGRAVLWILSRV